MKRQKDSTLKGNGDSGTSAAPTSYDNDSAEDAAARYRALLAPLGSRGRAQGAEKPRGSVTGSRSSFLPAVDSFSNNASLNGPGIKRSSGGRLKGEGPSAGVARTTASSSSNAPGDTTSLRDDDYYFSSIKANPNGSPPPVGAVVHAALDGDGHRPVIRSQRSFSKDTGSASGGGPARGTAPKAEAPGQAAPARLPSLFPDGGPPVVAAAEDSLRGIPLTEVFTATVRQEGTPKLKPISSSLRDDAVRIGSPRGAKTLLLLQTRLSGLVDRLAAHEDSTGSPRGLSKGFKVSHVSDNSVRYNTSISQNAINDGDRATPSGVALVGDILTSLRDIIESFGGTPTSSTATDEPRPDSETKDAGPGGLTGGGPGADLSGKGAGIDSSASHSNSEIASMENPIRQLQKKSLQLRAENVARTLTSPEQLPTPPKTPDTSAAAVTLLGEGSSSLMGEAARGDLRKDDTARPKRPEDAAVAGDATGRTSDNSTSQTNESSSIRLPPAIITSGSALSSLTATTSAPAPVVHTQSQKTGLSSSLQFHAPQDSPTNHLVCRLLLKSLDIREGDEEGEEEECTSDNIEEKSEALLGGDINNLSFSKPLTEALGDTTNVSTQNNSLDNSAILNNETSSRNSMPVSPSSKRTRFSTRKVSVNEENNETKNDDSNRRTSRAYFISKMRNLSLTRANTNIDDVDAADADFSTGAEHFGFSLSNRRQLGAPGFDESVISADDVICGAIRRLANRSINNNSISNHNASYFFGLGMGGLAKFNRNPSVAPLGSSCNPNNGANKSFNFSMAALSQSLEATDFNRAIMNAPLVQTPWRGSCALLFIDISGYSAVAAALVAYGPHALSSAVNAYWQRILAVVATFGGDVVSFAGDAVLVAWAPERRARGARLMPRDTVKGIVEAVTAAYKTTNTKALDLPAVAPPRPKLPDDELSRLSLAAQHRSLVAAAAACALVIQHTCGTHPVYQVEKSFSLHLALVFGAVESSAIMLPQHYNNMPRLYHSLTGDVLAEMSAAVAAAGPGDVCVSQTVRNMLRKAPVLDRTKILGFHQEGICVERPPAYVAAMPSTSAELAVHSLRFSKVSPLAVSSQSDIAATRKGGDCSAKEKNLTRIDLPLLNPDGGRTSVVESFSANCSICSDSEGNSQSVGHDHRPSLRGKHRHHRDSLFGDDEELLEGDDDDEDSLYLLSVSPDSIEAVTNMITEVGEGAFSEALSSGGTLDPLVILLRALMPPDMPGEEKDRYDLMAAMGYDMGPEEDEDDYEDEDDDIDESEIMSPGGSPQSSINPGSAFQAVSERRRRNRRFFLRQQRALDSLYEAEKLRLLRTRVGPMLLHNSLLNRLMAVSESTHLLEIRYLAVLFIHKNSLVSGGDNEHSQISPHQLTSNIFNAMSQSDDAGHYQTSDWFKEVARVLEYHAIPALQLIDDDKGAHIVAAVNLYEATRSPVDVAVRAAATIISQMLGCTIGIAAGNVFCGVVGDPTFAIRWDITGEAVVRACRLMQHGVATGVRLVVDEGTYLAMDDMSLLAELPKKALLKGVSGDQLIRAEDMTHAAAMADMDAMAGKDNTPTKDGTETSKETPLSTAGASVADNPELLQKLDKARQQPSKLIPVKVYTLAPATQSSYRIVSNEENWSEAIHVSEVAYMRSSILRIIGMMEVNTQCLEHVAAREGRLRAMAERWSPFTNEDKARNSIGEALEASATTQDESPARGTAAHSEFLSAKELERAKYSLVPLSTAVTGGTIIISGGHECGKCVITRRALRNLPVVPLIYYATATNQGKALSIAEVFVSWYMHNENPSIAAAASAVRDCMERNEPARGMHQLWRLLGLVLGGGAAEMNDAGNNDPEQAPTLAGNIRVTSTGSIIGIPNPTAAAASLNIGGSFRAASTGLPVSTTNASASSPPANAAPDAFNDKNPPPRLCVIVKNAQFLDHHSLTFMKCLNTATLPYVTSTVKVLEEQEVRMLKTTLPSSSNEITINEQPELSRDDFDPDDPGPHRWLRRACEPQQGAQQKQQLGSVVFVLAVNPAYGAMTADALALEVTPEMHRPGRKKKHINPRGIGKINHRGQHNQGNRRRSRQRSISVSKANQSTGSAMDHASILATTPTSVLARLFRRMRPPANAHQHAPNVFSLNIRPTLAYKQARALVNHCLQCVADPTLSELLIAKSNSIPGLVTAIVHTVMSARPYVTQLSQTNIMSIKPHNAVKIRRVAWTSVAPQLVTTLVGTHDALPAPMKVLLRLISTLTSVTGSSVPQNVLYAVSMSVLRRHGNASSFDALLQQLVHLQLVRLDDVVGKFITSGCADMCESAIRREQGRTDPPTPFSTTRKMVLVSMRTEALRDALCAAQVPEIIVEQNRRAVKVLESLCRRLRDERDQAVARSEQLASANCPVSTEHLLCQYMLLRALLCLCRAQTTAKVDINTETEATMREALALRDAVMAQAEHLGLVHGARKGESLSNKRIAPLKCRNIWKKLSIEVAVARLQLQWDQHTLVCTHHLTAIANLRRKSLVTMQAAMNTEICDEWRADHPWPDVQLMPVAVTLVKSSRLRVPLALGPLGAYLMRIGQLLSDLFICAARNQAGDDTAGYCSDSEVGEDEVEAARNQSISSCPGAPSAPMTPSNQALNSDPEALSRIIKRLRCELRDALRRYRLLLYGVGVWITYLARLARVEDPEWLFTGVVARIQLADANARKTEAALPITEAQRAVALASHVGDVSVMTALRQAAKHRLHNTGLADHDAAFFESCEALLGSHNYNEDNGDEQDGCGTLLNILSDEPPALADVSNAINQLHLYVRTTCAARATFLADNGPTIARVLLARRARSNAPAGTATYNSSIIVDHYNSIIGNSLNSSPQSSLTVTHTSTNATRVAASLGLSPGSSPLLDALKILMVAAFTAAMATAVAAGVPCRGFNRGSFFGRAANNEPGREVGTPQNSPIQATENAPGSEYIFAAAHRALVLLAQKTWVGDHERHSPAAIRDACFRFNDEPHTALLPMTLVYCLKEQLVGGGTM